MVKIITSIIFMTLAAGSLYCAIRPSRVIERAIKLMKLRKDERKYKRYVSAAFLGNFRVSSIFGFLFFLLSGILFLYSKDPHP